MKKAVTLCVCIYYINSEIRVTTSLGIEKNYSGLKVDSQGRKIFCLCVHVVQNTQATKYLL